MEIITEKMLVIRDVARAISLLENGEFILGDFHVKRFSGNMSRDLRYSVASTILDPELPRSSDRRLNDVLVPAIQILTDSDGVRLFYIPGTSKLLIRWKNGMYEGATTELIRTAGFELILAEKLEKYAKLLYSHLRKEWLKQQYPQKTDFSVLEELEFALWYSAQRYHLLSRQDLHKMFYDKLKTI